MKWFLICSNGYFQVLHNEYFNIELIVLIYKLMVWIFSMDVYNSDTVNLVSTTHIWGHIEA